MKVRKRSFFGILTLVGIGLLSGNLLFADYESLKYDSLSMQDSDYEDSSIDLTREVIEDKLQDDVFSYGTSKEVEAFIEYLNENKQLVDISSLDMAEEFFDRDVSNLQKIRPPRVIAVALADRDVSNLQKIRPPRVIAVALADRDVSNLQKIRPPRVIAVALADRDVSNLQKIRPPRVVAMKLTNKEEEVVNFIRKLNHFLGISSNVRTQVIDENYYFDSEYSVHSGK